MRINEEYSGLYLQDIKEDEMFIVIDDLSALNGKEGAKDYLFIKGLRDDGCNATYIRESTGRTNRFSFGHNVKVRRVTSLEFHIKVSDK